MTADGDLAATFEAGVHGAFGAHPGGGLGVIERRQQGQQLGIVGTAFDAQRALAAGRQADFGRQFVGDARIQPQPAQPGSGEDDRVEVAGIELAQPGLDVAAQAEHLEIGARFADLQAAAQARGAHPGALGQLLGSRIAVRHERIGGRGALEDHRQAEPLGEVHRHVLHRVHGDIGTSVEHGVLELLDEQPLAADLGQRRIEDLVALGGHRHQFHVQPRVQGHQPVAYVFGLPHGQAALAGGDSQGRHSRYWALPARPRQGLGEIGSMFGSALADRARVANRSPAYTAHMASS